MKNISIIALALLAGFITSCVEDLGTTQVTYNKATAIYGDLDALRATPLKADNQEIVDPGKVYVSEDLLLIGEETKGIHVFDNSDPANPSPLYFLNIPNNSEFYIEGNILYAESLYDMLKIDISNPQNPTLVSRVDEAFASAFTNNSGNSIIGFQYEIITEEIDKSSSIFSVLNDDSPIFFDFQENIIPRSNVPASFAGSSGSSIGTVNRIAVKEDHVYVISNSKIYTFQDSDGLSKLNESSIGWQMETIYPKDDNLFIGTQNSMEIFDIEDRSNPTYVSSFWHETSCDPVLPTDNAAYVTLRSGNECDGNIDALITIDITNLNNPFPKQELDMESPYGMTLIGSKLYVGEGSNGLKIFEVKSDDTLELLEFDTSIEAYDVIPHPTNSALILVASPEGFGQYQIKDDRRSLLSWISI